jgi:ribosomal RNA-processing protein 9
LESVAMIDEMTFLSGGDSGSICLWSTQKKKPVFTQPLAHGFNEVHSATEGLIQTPRWITALASLRYSDVFASGSWSNEIHIWKLDSSFKSFSLIGSVAAPGVVNSLQLFFPPTDFCHTSIWMPSPPSSTVSHPAPNGTEVEGSEPPIPQSHTQQQPNGDLQISTRPKKGVKTILLVAGMGQEHKFGRWLSVKEAAAANGTIIVAFNPSNR